MKDYVDILLIIATLLLLASRRCRRCWCLFVVVGVSALVPCCQFFVVDVLLSSLVHRCRHRRPFLWLRLLASVPRRCCLCRWVSYCWRRLVVVVVNDFLFLVSLLLGLLSSAASCCHRCRHRRRLVVVVGDGVAAFFENLSLY